MPLAVLEVFTRTVYPISSTRYYFCLSGIACIFLAAALAELMSKKLTYAALIALIAANSVKSNFDLYEEIKLSGIPQMKKIIEETNGGENIAFLHLHEFTVGIMAYYYPNAKHYVCDDTFTVLTDYSVFPNVIEIGNSDNIWKYTDKVYFFNGENYDAKIVSGEEEFSNMPSKPDFRLLGVYNSPYTYFDFDLEIAEKK